ncbi:hypothetical protein ABZ348_31170 [Streptomyces sp. NPDC005963]|uniref:hypothetical protein n=1 Tax=Streptomyces sp. NPDC005963 TaxID=3156721 RepID=UPI0033EA303C
MKLTKHLIALAAAVALVATASQSAVATDRPKAKSVQRPVAVSWAPAAQLPTKPCSEDDQTSRSCYWDAARMGNGKGYSYVVDARGEVTYLNPKLNDRSARVSFATQKKAAGWEFWGAVWGHQLCWAKVGETSYIHCFDGFKETS